MNELNLQLLEKIHEGANDIFDMNDRHTSHIAILRSWRDHEDPIKLKYEYDVDDNRFYDRLYNYQDFMDKCREFVDQEIEDTYFSINSFWCKRKRSEDIRHLNAFALDFDYYKIEQYSELTPADMYELIIKPELEKLELQPTAVVDSGRGLYVIYCFKHCSIVRTDLYRVIYRGFYKKLKDFGMDAKAMNVTQVIRLPGSYNSKASKAVEVIHLYDTTYEITDFCKLLPYTLESVKEYKRIKGRNTIEKLMAGPKEIKPRDEDKARRYRNLFLDDLKKLIYLRNKEGIKKGYRECLIYLAIDQMMRSGIEKEKAIQKAKNLNQQFIVPLKDGEVTKRCIPSRMFPHPHSIDKIIDKLNISEDQQQHMKLLKSKNARDLARKRLKNRHPLLNRKRKEVELLIRRSKVLALKKQGIKNKLIADKLSVDKSTITQDLNYIKSHKHEFRKVLGETIEALVAALQDDNLLRSVTYDTVQMLTKWLEMGAEALVDTG